MLAAAVPGRTITTTTSAESPPATPPPLLLLLFADSPPPPPPPLPIARSSGSSITVATSKPATAYPTGRATCRTIAPYTRVRPAAAITTAHTAPSATIATHRVHDASVTHPSTALAATVSE